MREELLQLQEGICPICNNPINSPCLDHRHSTKTKGINEIDGMVRRVICRSCNCLLGVIENNHNRFGIQYNDLPKMLENIATYLNNQPYTNLLHPVEARKHKPKKKTTKKLPKH